MNILYIEYNFFHDEVLIPQLDFLASSNHNIYLIANEEIKRTKETFDLSMVADLEQCINYKFIQKRYNKFKFLNYLNIIETLKFIYSHNIEIIIFNTIDILNDDIQLLHKFLPEKIKKIGILHNGLNYSKYEKRYDYIFVLSKLLKDNIKNDTFKVGYFYPILYKYRTKLKQPLKTKKRTIVISGNIEFTRRDYNFVLSFIKLNKKFLDKKGIQFIILGDITKSKDGLLLYQQIKDGQLEKYLKIYKYTIKYSEYINTILNADLIMALIHPENLNHILYMESKISASFNMAFSTLTPLLMHKSFEKVKEFKDFSFFYQNEMDLLNLLEYLFSKTNSLAEKRLNIKNNKDFNFEFQKQKYLQLIENIV